MNSTPSTLMPCKSLHNLRPLLCQYLLVGVASIVTAAHCSFSGVHIVDVSTYCVDFSIMSQISETESQFLVEMFGT